MKKKFTLYSIRNTVFISIIVACAIFGICWQVFAHGVTPRTQAQIKNTYTVTVTDKAPLPGGSSGAGYFYVVFGVDAAGEYWTFMLDDYSGRSNTSDWYGAIDRGKIYTFDTLGDRIGYLSQYPNIVAIEGFEVDELTGALTEKGD